MNEPEKREKVIKGLECCDGYCDDETGCPFDVLEPFDCQKQLRADAIALLKAQEPKVLALDEIHRGMAVWLEDVDKADVILAIGGSSGGGCKCFITVDDRSIAPHDSDYGVRWRAWTREPTAEQRRETHWM